MSDWIPVPEIENVLIVIAQLADTHEGIAEAPVMPLLQQLKQWHGGSVYVFHDPPEAGEVIEDVDPEIGTRFALAAQMTDFRGEVCRDAFRRVFSRATVKRVVLVAVDDGKVTVDKIQQLFDELDSADMVWAGEWPRRFALGMCSFHSKIFSNADDPNMDLRNTVETHTAEQRLSLHIVEGF